MSSRRATQALRNRYFDLRRAILLFPPSSPSVTQRGPQWVRPGVQERVASFARPKVVVTGISPPTAFVSVPSFVTTSKALVTTGFLLLLVRHLLALFRAFARVTRVVFSSIFEPHKMWSWSVSCSSCVVRPRWCFNTPGWLRDNLLPCPSLARRCLLRRSLQVRPSTSSHGFGRLLGSFRSCSGVWSGARTVSGTTTTTTTTIDHCHRRQRMTTSASMAPSPGQPVLLNMISYLLGPFLLSLSGDRPCLESGQIVEALLLRSAPFGWLNTVPG